MPWIRVEVEFTFAANRMEAVLVESRCRQLRIDLPPVWRAATQASALAHRELPILQFDRHTQYSCRSSADFS